MATSSIADALPLPLDPAQLLRFKEMNSCGLHGRLINAPLRMATSTDHDADAEHPA